MDCGLLTDRIAESSSATCINQTSHDLMGFEFPHPGSRVTQSCAAFPPAAGHSTQPQQRGLQRPSCCCYGESQTKEALPKKGLTRQATGLLPDIRTHTQQHTCTNTHMHTRARVHTHTHTCTSVSVFMCLKVCMLCVCVVCERERERGVQVMC
mmetsp:Transcript_30337/g.78877  ORF Transcript_30337/g.78877 Transcript_30337/m.78877 type:complete len:153 (+) Transcript_30337:535-993(+)